MYSNKITLFNRYHSATGDTWYAKVLDNVDLIIDKGAINKVYGAESTDLAKLHVKFEMVNEDVIIGGYKFLTPKEWEKLTNDDLPLSITFKSGQYFDFFYEGEYPDAIIDDDTFRDGFYNYMNKNYDNVFAISSVSNPYMLIPHFEITGK